MSIFPKETVQSIAESIGLTVNDQIASTLMQDTEYRLRQIVVESVKFMKHSNRKKLLPSDINSALQLKNVQSNFKTTVHQSQNIYYLEDAEIDLEELVNKPLPPVPLDITWTCHWLAIEGVQPKIVQNPSNIEIVKPQQEQKTEVKVETTTKQILTLELQLYYEKITESIVEPELQQLALESISSDPGIQALLPYFLHQILPSILTLIVAKNIESKETRHQASKLLLALMNRFSTTYQGLQARITKTLLRALLDPTKPPSTLYGAVYALNCMGPEVVQLLIVPHLDHLERKSDGELDSLVESVLDGFVRERGVELKYKNKVYS
ncbi:Transcription initiation factor TFIID subunit 6 [Terramyces sp. JEL0728]|nr:Transcription initiation factor TFIID subunit 6 [Terramyces sp. JEL0728]